MRVVVFVLAAYISIAPAVAAWNFVIQAGVATVGTMAKSAGKYIKIPNKKELLLQGGGGAALAYCANNKKCRDAVGDGIDELLDMMTDSDDDSSTCYYVEGAMDRIVRNQSDACRVTHHNHRLSGYRLQYKNHGGYGYCFSHSGDNYPVYKTDCFSLGKQEEQRKQELTKKIINNIDDREINYIINSYGDDIDIDKYCASNACDEMSKEFGQEVENNQNKYDIDKINKANCVVEQGKIVSCDNAKIDIDKEETNHEKDDDSDDKTHTKKTDKEDDEPHFCKTSDLTKELCEFLDWVDDEPKKPESEKVDIEDDSIKDKLDKDKIDVDKRCPPDEIIDYRIGDYDAQLKITFKPYCDFAFVVRPIIVSSGTLSALYILAGLRRED